MIQQKGCKSFLKEKVLNCLFNGCIDKKTLLLYKMKFYPEPNSGNKLKPDFRNCSSKSFVEKQQLMKYQNLLKILIS